jgi:transposase InsO family protein
MVWIGRQRGWPGMTMAKVMGVKSDSLKRWLSRLDTKSPEPAQPGRKSVVPAHVRLKIRNCYVAHYKQWGPRVLADWARREGLGHYSPSTISRVIEDLKETPVKKDKLRRYEITAPNVIWSEDGAGFRECGRKKELLVLQDECSRFKVNTRLVSGPAKGEDVYEYLREAFEKHGAPLIIKHDGGSIFSEKKVRNLLDEYCVVDLKSPPHYPPYNGKMERSIRDIKSYEKAVRRRDRQNLKKRIEAAVHDLNEERPRPVLGGKTAREVFKSKCMKLPDKRMFYLEVKRMKKALVDNSCSRRQEEDAGRKATEKVLLRYGLMKEITDMSTYLNQKTGTY